MLNFLKKPRLVIEALRNSNERLKERLEQAEKYIVKLEEDKRRLEKEASKNEELLEKTKEELKKVLVKKTNQEHIKKQKWLKGFYGETYEQKPAVK